MSGYFGMAERQNVSKTEEEPEKKVPVKKNDIRFLSARRQLAKVNLDLDSPRMREAMTISGVEAADLEIK